jgi:hypothetical protein
MSYSAVPPYLTVYNSPLFAGTEGHLSGLDTLPSVNGGAPANPTQKILSGGSSRGNFSHYFRRGLSAGGTPSLPGLPGYTILCHRRSIWNFPHYNIARSIMQSDFVLQIIYRSLISIAPP